jgi:hypothetical protein
MIPTVLTLLHPQQKSYRIVSTTKNLGTESSTLLSIKGIHLTNVDDLEDVVVGGELIGPNVEVDVLAAAQEVLRQSLHLLRPGSAPHAPEHQVKKDYQMTSVVGSITISYGSVFDPQTRTTD